MSDIITPPREAQAIISITSNLESQNEATSTTPENSSSCTKATQGPPRSPKRKINDDDECSEATPTPPKKRKVTFNSETYVRSESNIDVLRHQYFFTAASDGVINHTIRPLEGTRCGRRNLCWRKSSRYCPGDWVVSKGCENVNTSGCGSKKFFDKYAGVDETGDEKLWAARQKECDAWDEYVETLDAEGKKNDSWSEMARYPRSFLVARPQRFLEENDWPNMLLGTIASAPRAHVLVSALLWQFIRRT